MKHGQKSEQKSAKTLKKASAGKAGSKARPAEKAAKPSAGAKTAKSSPKTAPKKESRPPEPAKRGSTSPAGGARKTNERAEFSNPAVARAFERAVKKYPNAFKRLTD